MMKNTYYFDEKLVWNEVYENWQDQGRFNDHYHAYLGKSQDLSLPMLPPPKRFLKSGSIYWVSPDVKYTFGEDTRVPYSTKIAVRKYHNIDNKTLRLLRLGYFFIRDKDCMSESKKNFRSIVYNVEKKALYTITASPSWPNTKKGTMAKRHRWGKMTRRVSLDGQSLGMLLDYFDFSHVERFINDLKKVVSKEVPDVCDICTKDPNRIIALILQHRIGKSIPNLNNTFIENIGMISRHEFVSSRFNQIMSTDERNERRVHSDNSWKEEEKAIRKLKRNSVYKFIPTLKETNSVKKALRIMLGECYVGIFPKILFDINWSDYRYNTDALINYKNNVPKALQHYIVHSLKELPANEFKDLFTNTIQLSRSFHVEDNVKESWIRIIRRLNEIIPWDTWKDTYSMANDLGIRVRPNRFSSMEDVMTLHDNFSRIIRRNRNIANPGLRVNHDAKFVDIEYPKEFEGYKFKQLLTPQELMEETDIMGHCVHSYDRNCVSGDSIIFSATGPDERRWTIEYSGADFVFIQAEGRQADNGGRRSFCPSEINSSIFIPFGNVIKRLYTNKLSYKMRCTLNLGTIGVREKAYALCDIIELNMEGANLKVMDAELNLCNCLLEDLIEFDRLLDTSKLTKLEVMTHINNLLNRVESVGKVVPLHITPRRAVQPNVAQPVPERLFPHIPEQVIRAVQEAPDPFDVMDYTPEEQQIIEDVEDVEFPF